MRGFGLVLLVCVAACGGRIPNEPIPPRPEVPGGPYTAGNSYFGRNQYIEYIAGNLPLIFTAPHGGTLTPAEIPDRAAPACGGTATTVRDSNTDELARAVRTAFFNQTGRYPHVIINRLHRQKLDANRDRIEAACNDAEAAVAFDEFHAFVEIAKRRVLLDHGRAWYTDLHGHGHAIARLELGYLLEAEDLRLNDSTLNATSTFENESSIRTFSAQTAASFAAVLRGPSSLGTLLSSAGFPSVPSASDPAPLADQLYFTGGYNTVTHACSTGGNICGVQIESHFAGVRDTQENRLAFATALARVYETFLSVNFGLVLQRTP